MLLLLFSFRLGHYFSLIFSVSVLGYDISQLQNSVPSTTHLEDYTSATRLALLTYSELRTEHTQLLPSMLLAFTLNPSSLVISKRRWGWFMYVLFLCLVAGASSSELKPVQVNSYHKKVLHFLKA